MFKLPPKPPYPSPRPTPKRLLTRKTVTFILGLKCVDGLVLFSDSLESDGYVTKNVQKIFWFEHPGKWGVAFGCSGSAAACSNFGDRLLDQLRAEKSFDRRTMEKQIELHVNYFSQQYPKERLQIVIGLYSMETQETRLYLANTDNECLSVQTDYACAGMDVSLARFLLDSVYDERVTVTNAMHLGAFITCVMKEKADGVAGPTQILSFRVNHPHWFAPEPKVITRIERGGFIEGQFRFEELEKTVRHFFWRRSPHEFTPEKKR